MRKDEERIWEEAARVMLRHIVNGKEKVSRFDISTIKV